MTSISAVAGSVALSLCFAGFQTPSVEFPGTEWREASSIEGLGWSPVKVAALEGRVKAVGSSAFLIVTRGQVVAAWGDTSRTFLTHSIRKSFISALYGLAVAEGKIDINRTLGALGVTEKTTTLTQTERQARLVDLLKARSGVYIAAAVQQLGLQRSRQCVPAADR